MNISIGWNNKIWICVYFYYHKKKFNIYLYTGWFKCTIPVLKKLLHNVWSLMFKHITLQNTILVTTQVSMCFPPGVLSSVLSHHPSKKNIKLTTLMWFITSVCCLVIYQITLLGKTFVTLAALIWSLSSVCYLVFYQMILFGITFVTLAALIWFLSSVCSLVVYQTFHLEKNICHTGCIDMVSLQCVFSGGM